MTDKEIRDLRADEVEVRVNTVDERGCSLLLYKDARCDMNILDETFGIFGWQKHYEMIGGQLFCTIEIWDDEKKCWIAKQDVGVESNSEPEKGRASDAQKRAAFCVGIGRELYTAPKIWIPANKIDLVQKKDGKLQVKTYFKVTHMEIENKRIVSLEIAAKSRGRDWEEVYSMSNKKPVQEQPEQKQPPPEKQEALTRMELISALYNMDRKICNMTGSELGSMVKYCVEHSPFDLDPSECNESELRSLIGIMKKLEDEAEKKYA